jgi:hypothetical protein
MRRTYFRGRTEFVREMHIDMKTIEQMHEAKIQRYDNGAIGAQIGGLMHDAVTIVMRFTPGFTAKTDKERNKLILKDIAYWLHELREIADKEKEPKPVDFEKAQEKWDEKKQELYEQDAKLDDIRRGIEEIKNVRTH